MKNISDIILWPIGFVCGFIEGFIIMAFGTEEKKKEYMKRVNSKN